MQSKSDRHNEKGAAQSRALFFSLTNGAPGVPARPNKYREAQTPKPEESVSSPTNNDFSRNPMNQTGK
jgi:hypothetical protein